MVTTKKIAVVLIFLGGMIMSGCELINKSEDNSKNALLLVALSTSAAVTQGSTSFSEGGTTSSMTTPFGWQKTGSAYLTTFLKNGTDANNKISITLPDATMSAKSYTQATTNFSFDYIKNSVLYTESGSSGFTFNITSVSGGKASGTFSGILVPFMGGSNITISSGTFSGVIIH